VCLEIASLTLSRAASGICAPIHSRPHVDDRRLLFWRLRVLVDRAYPTVILRYPELKSPTKITQELVQFAELGPSPAEIRTAVAFMDSPQGTSARAIGIKYAC
jgi:hypothetical protein